MRTVVLGASGYIGSRLLTAAAACGPAIGTASSQGHGVLQALDLAEPAANFNGLFAQADFVYVAAALSSPDVCAKEPERARAVNVIGTIRAIESAVAAGAKVIFLSSDTVYGERDDDVDESACCRPAGAYAAMKHEVERHFAGNRYVRSIRLSYIFSRADKFTRYLCQCAGSESKADIFHPFYRAIVHVTDVIDALMGMARLWDRLDTQFVNVGGPQIISRIEFAETLRRLSLPGLNISVTEPAADFFLSRPRIISMRSPHLVFLLGRQATSFEDAVRIEFNQRAKPE